jgi:hypothetical protein
LLVRGIDRGRSHHEEPDFFLYDIVRQDGKEIAFKAVQERSEIGVDSQTLPELHASVTALLHQDPTMTLIREIKLTKRSLD